MRGEPELFDPEAAPRRYTEVVSELLNMTPSEAVRKGVCPFCLGLGTVTRFVPVEGTYPCGYCEGTAKFPWPPE